MRKVFYKYLLLLIVVYLTFAAYLSVCKVCYNSPNSTRWRITREILQQKYDLSDSSIEILFLGDSRLNAALDYNKIPNCWTFASGGATATEMYFILKKYLKKYPKPETVVISFSPRFFTQKFAFWDLAVRNGCFDFNDFKEIFYIHKKFPDDTLWDKCSWCKFGLYEIYFPSVYQNEVYNAKVFFAKKKNLALEKYIFSHRGARPHTGLKDSCAVPNYETTMQTFNYSKIIDYFFDKILKLCVDSGIYVIFYPMPMNKASEKLLASELISAYKYYINYYARRYPEFYISDTLLYYNNVYFGDASHLNERGKIKFTEFFTERFTPN